MSKIGWNLEQQQSYEYALSYFFQAQAIYQQMGQEAKLPRIYLHLGSIHNHLDHLDSANFYLQKALNLARQIQDDVLQISSLAELGQLYEKLGDNTKARLTLEQAFRQADERSLVTAKVKQARTLYYLFKKLNRTQEALLYNEIYWAIRDSLVAAENARSLFRLEADYEFEKELQQFGHGEERQAKEKSEQLKRSRLIRLIISLILFLTVVILLIVYRYYQLKQDANKKLMRLSQRVVRQKNILQIQNKQLRELDQMKSHFFTNISHEFRTPLTVIDGMIQQIKKAPDKWMEKGLKMIERSNANLLRLINQILDLRKLESGKLNLQLEQGDVISYVKEIFESFEAVGKNKDVKLHLLSQQRALMMYYDAEKLLRLLSNLLSNAIKFTPAGGHVYVLIALNRNAEVLENLKDSAGLAIKVKDTGAGIPTEKLPFIFDRFYQVADWENQEKRGTGIGLALAKELVNVMKGSIKVSSELGKGTTFEVFLPLRYPDALG